MTENNCAYLQEENELLKKRIEKLKKDNCTYKFVFAINLVTIVVLILKVLGG